MQREFLRLIALRRSSPLFHLHTGSEIRQRVRFLETELGPMQQPGLVVMEIRDENGDVDPRWRRLLVAVNVTNAAAVFPHESFRAAPLQVLYGAGELHPSRDAQLSLPARSLTVWGEAR